MALVFGDLVDDLDAQPQRPRGCVVRRLDLRTILGEPVKGKYHLRYCGNGSIDACAESHWQALHGAVDEAAKSRSSSDRRGGARTRRPRASLPNVPRTGSRPRTVRRSSRSWSSTGRAERRADSRPAGPASRPHPGAGPFIPRRRRSGLSSLLAPREDGGAACATPSPPPCATRSDAGGSSGRETLAGKPAMPGRASARPGFREAAAQAVDARGERIGSSTPAAFSPSGLNGDM